MLMFNGPSSSVTGLRIRPTTVPLRKATPMSASARTRVIAVGLLLSGVSLVFTSGAVAAAKKGQLCAASAVNTQDSGLTCTKDANGRFRWTAGGTAAPATTAPAVPSTKKPATTKKPSTTKKSAAAAPTTVVAVLSTTKTSRATKTVKPASATPTTLAGAAGAVTAKKGQFCKRTAIGQTATGPGGVTLTCTASATGGTPHWKQA